jgi:hypothetical protein
MEQILLRNLERCLHNRIHYLDHHLVHNRILERNVEVHVVVVELDHGELLTSLRRAYLTYRDIYSVKLASHCPHVENLQNQNL